MQNRTGTYRTPRMTMPAGVPWLARLAVPEPPRSPQFIPYDIPVRPGVRARFVLPADLTAADGERLCGIIRAIAFPADRP